MTENMLKYFNRSRLATMRAEWVEVAQGRAPLAGCYTTADCWRFVRMIDAEVERRDAEVAA